MAKTNIWMPFYIGDYLADTTSLTTEQHGAYMLLIFAYWTNRGPLPDDDEELARITRMGVKEWRITRRRISKFFEICGGFWRHRRIESEMEKALANSAKRSQSAKKAAEAKWAKAEQNSNPSMRGASVTHPSRIAKHVQNDASDASATQCDRMSINPDDQTSENVTNSQEAKTPTKEGQNYASRNASAMPSTATTTVQTDNARARQKVLAEEVAPPVMESDRPPRPNSVEMVVAQAAFVRINEQCAAEPGFTSYTAEEVRQAWHWFESGKDPETGEWLQMFGTQRKPVGDWKAAMMERIGHNRNIYAKRNTNGPTGTPLEKYGSGTRRNAGCAVASGNDIARAAAKRAPKPPA